MISEERSQNAFLYLSGQRESFYEAAQSCDYAADILEDIRKKPRRPCLIPFGKHAYFNGYVKASGTVYKHIGDPESQNMTVVEVNVQEAVDDLRQDANSKFKQKKKIVT